MDRAALAQLIAMRGNHPMGGPAPLGNEQFERPREPQPWQTYEPLPEGWLPPGSNWNANPPQPPSGEWYDPRARLAPRFHVPPGKELAPPGGQVSMRPGDPTAGRPPAANFIPPDWWQGGGPQQQPPPAATYAPMAQGFPLEGRSRWGNAPGNDFMQEQYDGQTQPGDAARKMLEALEAQRKLDAMQPPARPVERERIAPRQYGIGQEV